MISKLKTISWPWAVAALLWVAVIWGNSLVPASGSSGMSHAVLDAVRGVLRDANLPYAWLTNFIVRKSAHFSEYMLLGILVTQALAGERALSLRRLAMASFVLVCVPALDETIQLFTPGRSGQVSDVMLDCCGAATGVAVRSLVAWGRAVL